MIAVGRRDDKKRIAVLIGWLGLTAYSLPTSDSSADTSVCDSHYTVYKLSIFLHSDIKQLSEANRRKSRSSNNDDIR